jgi:dihydrofolate synthase/folylpolyglutamate synthase
MKNYAETLEYLFAQLPMFQRIGAAAYKKDLTNITALCAQMGGPQSAFPVVHIAGTNGKGTVTHLLAAALQAAGLRTGIYTSPHFKDFRERIKVNGAYVPESFVVDFTARHLGLFDTVKPSFFEMSTAMAFDFFRQEKVDVAVIETGMGGRLDSTNIVDPALCVITNISFDHTQFLGPTLPLIAGEKAGIIKRNTPVVIGERHPETEPVFRQKASEMEAPLFFSDENWTLEAIDHQQYARTRFALSETRPAKRARELEPLQVELFGNYQQLNVRTAWAAAQKIVELGLFPLEESHIRKGFAQVRQSTAFRGRWEKMPGHPLAFAESAHNPAGLEQLRQQLDQIPHRALHLVLGVVNDKDLAGILPLLPRHARFYFCRPDVPRGLDAEILADAARSAGLQGSTFSRVGQAWQAALSAAGPEDLVLATGSMFVVAELL